jgi:hypothetical protein
MLSIAVAADSNHVIKGNWTDPFPFQISARAGQEMQLLVGTDTSLS